MTSAQLGICISIIVYLAGMLAIGVWCSKRTNDSNDFYLGGRKLGPLVTAMSAEASDMSSWLLMGLPGVAYLCGIADAGWTAIGLALGTYFNWLIVARRIRIYTHVSNNSITIPDFFHNRYRDKSCLLMAISAIVIVIFFIPYTASGFAACGKLFATLFNVDYQVAMIISAIVIVGYTATGGFLAASTTDFIQSIIMTIALVIVLGFGISSAGGFGAVIENAKALPGYLTMFQTHDAATGTAATYGPVTILSTLAWGLGYFGMPHILLRFMAIEDDRKLALSRRVASVWVVIAMGIAILIGVIGLGMTSAGSMERLADSETIIVRIADLLSQHGFLFALLAGVILAGILASTMSTADSQLLAASSSVSENLLQGVFKLKITQKGSILIARVTLVIISIIGVFMARDPNSSVFGIVSFAWAGFGAAFGPVVLFALFWKRSNRWGALAGMISGGAMVFIWEYVITPYGKAVGNSLLTIYELLPAFLVACAAIVIVSLVTAPPSKEITDEYDKVSAMMKE